MKKKLYNQPEILISRLAPTTIICASITNGGSTDNLTPPGSGEIDND